LESVSTIYYSPSGLLHKIAFGALPTGDDEEIDFENLDFENFEEKDVNRLADKYDLNLVSSTREVVHLSRGKTEAVISSAVLYGGLDYNASAQAMREAARPYRKEDDNADIVSRLPEWLLRETGYSLLPTSRDEALTVQGYLNRKNVPNNLYLGSLGNEESFKALTGKKTGLIYLATHGFFLADVERKHDEREQLQQSQRTSALKASENPLLRSGLLLAGGNNALLNKPVEGAESGVLTADKIAGINLLGAQLVVLSACQTGLGDVNNKEGVFGLQRSFKLAGVETLIMSLWEVDAESSAKLMSVFLQEWLFSGKSRQAAFKEAQRQVRTQYPEPYHWAAFVMLD
jgi:CHAT domain-containing protein